MSNRALPQSPKPKLTIVIPSVRPHAFLTWWQKWQPQLEPRFGKDVALVVVWDLESVPNLSEEMSKWFGQLLVLPSAPWVHQLCWSSIPEDWKLVVHTKSDSVRNFGFLYAAQLGSEIIATLDDDVYPTDLLWIDRMLHNLSRKVNPYIFNPVLYRTRGYPEQGSLDVPVLLHHGLWDGVPDVYAKDQLTYQPLDGSSQPVKTIPYGQLFPMCGMNLAFRRELLPAMYFWPQDPYRRYGDIWCGLVAKKVVDISRGAATSGSPLVFHSRLSDRESNLKHESSGAAANALLWEELYSHWPEDQLSIWEATQFVAKHAIPNRVTDAVMPQLEQWLEITRSIK